MKYILRFILNLVAEVIVLPIAIIISFSFTNLFYFLWDFKISEKLKQQNKQLYIFFKELYKSKI